MLERADWGARQLRRVQDVKGVLVIVCLLAFGGCGTYSPTKFAELCQADAQTYVLNENLWQAYTREARKKEREIPRTIFLRGEDSARLKVKWYWQSDLESERIFDEEPKRNDLTLFMDEKIVAVMKSYSVKLPMFGHTEFLACTNTNGAAYFRRAGTPSAMVGW